MNVCYKRVSVWWSTASERGRGGKGSWCCCCLSQCNWTELSDYKQYSENTQSVSEWLTALLLLIAYQQQQRCQERPVCVCVCVAAGRVWKVSLDPVSDTGPYIITATLLASPSHTIHLRDVLFGDVWLCVGQNKLHHSVNKVSALPHPLAFLRLFNTRRCRSHHDLHCARSSPGLKLKKTREWKFSFGENVHWCSVTQLWGQEQNTQNFQIWRVRYVTL